MKHTFHIILAALVLAASVHVPCALDVPVDLNADGTVDTRDLQSIIAELGAEEATMSDVNRDGIVDVRDIQIAVTQTMSPDQDLPSEDLPETPPAHQPPAAQVHWVAAASLHRTINAAELDDASNNEAASALVVRDILPTAQTFRALRGLQQHAPPVA